MLSKDLNAFRIVRNITSSTNQCKESHKIVHLLEPFLFGHLFALGHEVQVKGLVPDHRIPYFVDPVPILALLKFQGSFTSPRCLIGVFSHARFKIFVMTGTRDAAAVTHLVSGVNSLEKKPEEPSLACWISQLLLVMHRDCIVWEKTRTWIIRD